MTQKTKDPAATAIAPGHGSILQTPSKDQKMNITEHSTGTAAAPAPDISTLETPIMDAIRMASINASLMERALASSKTAPQFYIGKEQAEDLLFAAYHTQDLLRDVFSKWEALA